MMEAVAGRVKETIVSNQWTARGLYPQSRGKSWTFKGLASMSWKWTLKEATGATCTRVDRGCQQVAGSPRIDFLRIYPGSESLGWFTQAARRIYVIALANVKATRSLTRAIKWLVWLHSQVVSLRIYYITRKITITFYNLSYTYLLIRLIRVTFTYARNTQEK